MARNQRTTTASVQARRKYVRTLVPVGVAGAVVASVALVPAFAAGDDDPDLPDVSARKLLEKVADSDADTMSGTVRSDVDLGLPGMPGSSGGSAGKSGSPFGSSAGKHGAHGKESKDGAAGTAAPQQRLAELASGEHTLRVAQDGPDKQSVALVEKTSEYRMVHNGADVYAYDSQKNAVWHAKKPSSAHDARQHQKRGTHGLTKAPTSPKKAADQLLKHTSKSSDYSVDGTTTVAGRDAYTLVVSPKQSGSTVKEVRVAVDAKNGVPLKVTVEPASGGKPVVDVGYTKVSFSKPSAKLFDFHVPKGATVTEATPQQKRSGKQHTPGAQRQDNSNPLSSKDVKTFGTGWATVARVNLPDGAMSAEPKGGKAAKDEETPKNLGSLANMLGTQVKGDFGTGTVVKTRVVNALITKDGTVYVGAVSSGNLIKAANSDS